MVDVPAGLAKNPFNSFAQSEQEFPVENRLLIGKPQVKYLIRLFRLLNKLQANIF